MKRNGQAKSLLMLLYPVSLQTVAFHCERSERIGSYAERRPSGRSGIALKRCSDQELVGITFITNVTCSYKRGSAKCLFCMFLPRFGVEKPQFKARNDELGRKVDTKASTFIRFATSLDSRFHPATLIPRSRKSRRGERHTMSRLVPMFRSLPTCSRRPVCSSRCIRLCRSRVVALLSECRL